MKTLWIGFAGAVGTVARYYLDGVVQKRIGASFPYGTLTVNLLGSFLIATIMHVGLRTDLMPAQTRIVLTTGLLGGFTTYSTFNYETLRCFEDGAWIAGGLNVVVTVLGCLAAGGLGWVFGKWLVGV